MAETSGQPEQQGEPEPITGAAMSNEAPKPARSRSVHEVTFTAYPKLLFVWPVILAGFVLWPLAGGADRPVSQAPLVQAESPGAAGEPAAADDEQVTGGEDAAGAAGRAATTGWNRREVIGWIYIWLAVLVLLTLGVDIDRNKAAFLVVLVGGLYVLGLWLHDAKGFTLFGDIFRWFAGLDVQYERSLALALSIILLVPYLVMLAWAWLNDRWRITHNEFEHYAFGKMNDSLGRGAKTIRTEFPDVFELLLGLAGTLIVYNATGTKELRRIPHVMFLPLIRKRLDKILEKTAITAGQLEEEEEDDDA